MKLDEISRGLRTLKREEVRKSRDMWTEPRPSFQRAEVETGEDFSRDVDEARPEEISRGLKTLRRKRARISHEILTARCLQRSREV